MVKLSARGISFEFWLVGSLDSGSPLGLVRVIFCAPFTRIRILLKLQLFLSGFKNFPVHMFSDSLWICYFPLGRGNLKICGFAWAGGRKLNLERKSCGFKNIRICVDGAFVLGKAGSISAALSRCLHPTSGRSTGSSPKQWLVIEPMAKVAHKKLFVLKYSLAVKPKIIITSGNDCYQLLWSCHDAT